MYISAQSGKSTGPALHPLGSVSYTHLKEAVAYIEKNNQFPIVVKADGLALGKGVLIAADLTEAKDCLLYTSRCV